MKTFIKVGLGILGLGGVAALLLKKKEEPVAPAAPGLPGIPGLIPPGPPSAPPSGGGGLVFVQDALSVHLRQGQYYRGRLNLLGISLPPFNLSATEEQIGKGLVAIGFVDVRVFMNVSNLPSDWPRETAMNTQQGTRWFQGRWTGLTADVPKPFVVEQVWVTASPAVAAQQQASVTSGGSGIRGDMNMTG